MRSNHCQVRCGLCSEVQHPVSEQITIFSCHLTYDRFYQIIHIDLENCHISLAMLKCYLFASSPATLFNNQPKLAFLLEVFQYLKRAARAVVVDDDDLEPIIDLEEDAIQGVSQRRNSVIVCHADAVFW